jgi:hypothetical protein
LLQTPELVNVTAFPLAPPVAATGKLLLYAAEVGGFVVNVIACAAGVAFTVCVTGVAAA